MRIVLFVLFVSAVNISFGQSAGEPTTNNFDSIYAAKKKALIGTAFPSFTANDRDVIVSNELLKGKAVLINFWFEGCHPCMTEMAMLNEINEKFKDSADFLFVSFTFDNKKVIQRVKDKFGITFKILSTSQKECGRLNFNSGYPTSIVLDKAGVIKYVHGGGFDQDLITDEKISYNEFLQRSLLSEIKSLL